MNDFNSQNLPAEFLVLQKAFVEALAPRISEIKALWSKFQLEPNNAETGKALITNVHNLVGAGGLYGYHAVTTVARELELAINEFKASVSDPCNHISSIHKLIIELEQASPKS